MVGFGCWRKLLLHIDNTILILHCKCLPGWSMHCICQMGKLSSPQKFSLADSGCWPFAIHHRDCNGNMHCLMHCTMYMNSAFNSVVRSKLECPTKLCPLKGLRRSGGPSGAFPLYWPWVVPARGMGPPRPFIFFLLG